MLTKAGFKNIKAINNQRKIVIKTSKIGGGWMENNPETSLLNRACSTTRQLANFQFFIF